MKDEQYISEKFVSFCESIDPELDDEIKGDFPQFVIYRNDGEGYYYCKCSACRERYIVPKRTFRSEGIRHNSAGICRECGEEIRYITAGKVPALSYYRSSNYVVVNSADGDVYLSCVNISQQFSDELGHDWDEISDYDVCYRVLEKQRYYLTPGAELKWNRSSAKAWTPVKRFSEPHFMSSYGYSSWIGYKYLGIERLRNSFLKYCCAEEFAEYLHDNQYEFPLITYLQKASRYPILEKLIKSGFEEIVARWLTKDGPRVTFQLRAKTIQKALDLNSDEMDYIRNSSNVADTYRSYLKFRSKLEVSGNFAQRIEKHERFGRAVDNIVDISKLTGLSHEKTMGYIVRQTNGQDTHACSTAWLDYLKQCVKLDYNVRDTAICKPRNLWEAHNRLTKLISNKENTEMNDALVSRINSRKWLEFESGRFVVIQPQSVGEIIVEGKRLDHCVGGYIGEHAAGNTNIMFLRMKARPWKPFYTMEIDNMGVIRQCHGYGNNVPSKHGVPKTQEIKDFEAEYQKYLFSQFSKRLKKSGKVLEKARKTA